MSGVDGIIRHQCARRLNLCDCHSWARPTRGAWATLRDTEDRARRLPARLRALRAWLDQVFGSDAAHAAEVLCCVLRDDICAIAERWPQIPATRRAALAAEIGRNLDAAGDAA